MTAQRAPRARAAKPSPIPARPRARKARSEGGPAPAMGHNQGPPLREVAREQAREYLNTGYFDREGNPIRRKNPNYRAQYDFQPGEIPEGWVYQWIRHTVHGDPESSELWDMQENGWRPVPWERHKNRFGPTDLTFDGGAKKRIGIMRQGQLLVERPEGMNVDAFRQNKRDADAAIGDQFRRFEVPLPDNVRSMGLEGRAARANRETADVGQVKADFMPKLELEI